MRMSWRKVISWSLLALGAGGTLYHVWLAAISTGESEWLWRSLHTLPLALMPAVPLYYCYRAEPLAGTGRWQIGLADLLVVVLSTGLLMAGMHELADACYDECLPPRFVFPFLWGALLLTGLFVATRRGFHGLARWFYAAGIFGCVYGALALGAIAVQLPYLIATGGGDEVRIFFVKLLWQGPGLNERGFPENPWIYVPLHLGLIALPAGVLLCWEGKRVARR